MRIKSIANDNIKRIHINRHTMAKNKKLGLNNPPIGIETSGRKKEYASKVWILGPSAVVHSEDKPLSCGARCWIETRSPLEFVTEHPPDPSLQTDEA